MSNCLDPCTSDVVLRALRRLEPADAVPAVVHLATPVDVAVGLQVKLDGAVLRWRGVTTTIALGPWSQLCTQVCDFVRQLAREDDRFLDLSDDPVAWLKLVRSGALVHLAGARELFDAQHVTFDLAVPVRTARQLAGRVASGRPLTDGTLLLGGVPVWIHADAAAAHVAA